jgi:hypothetical protein
MLMTDTAVITGPAAVKGHDRNINQTLIKRQRDKKEKCDISSSSSRGLVTAIHPFVKTWGCWLYT